MSRVILSLAALILALASSAAGVGAVQAPQVAATAPANVTGVSPELEMQILLDRAGFSPGEIDGRGGANTTRATTAFRAARQLDGADAAALRTALQGDGVEVLTSYTITDEDAAGPFLATMPSDMKEQAKLPALSYVSVLEMIAERTHASPLLLQQLNPGSAFAAGDQIRVPNIEPVVTPASTATDAPAPVGAKGTRVVVSKGASGLTVYDSSDRVLFFAPVTSGSKHDPLPIGTWAVKGVARNPTFNYNPALFWDAEPGDTKAKIPAGPNGPVGTVWIDLNKPHYGIHGTAEPRTVGHAASHGCVRLTNWNAEIVARLVSPGTVVIFKR